MLSEDGQSLSSSVITVPSTVVPIINVPPGARVHRFDELSERIQHALTSTSPAGRLDIDTTTSWLSRGNIVVFTSYIRVQ